MPSSATSAKPAASASTTFGGDGYSVASQRDADTGRQRPGDLDADATRLAARLILAIEERRKQREPQRTRAGDIGDTGIRLVRWHRVD